MRKLQKKTPKKEKSCPGGVTQSWVWEQNLNLNIQSTSRREKVHRAGHSRWKQGFRYRSVSLGFWCPSVTLCSFTKLAMPHLPAIISNNAFQIVCFQCRAWNTLDCVSECQDSCPFSPDTWNSSLFSFHAREVVSLGCKPQKQFPINLRKGFTRVGMAQ